MTLDQFEQWLRAELTTRTLIDCKHRPSSLGDALDRLRKTVRQRRDDIDVLKRLLAERGVAPNELTRCPQCDSYWIVTAPCVVCGASRVDPTLGSE